MPPKKKKEKKSSEPSGPAEDPVAFLQAYVKMCKLIDIKPCQQVMDTLGKPEDLEEFMKSRQLVISGPDPTAENSTEARLGPAGSEALCTTMLGTGPGMTTCFTLIKFIRIWWSNIGDNGACALAELLRLGGAEVQIQYMELWDNNICARGAMAIGKSLMVGNNKSLLTLKLNYNRSLGSEGVAALCAGLQTNSTLKHLHLPFCNITAEAGIALSEMLMYTRLALNTLNLQGNQLRGRGLENLCPGLERCTSIIDLNLDDNDIGEYDIEPLTQFANVLILSASLARVSLIHNWIGEPGGQALLPALAPEMKRIQQFLVDDSVPPPLFGKLLRVSSGAKGGKKKGKKGKKKK